MLKGEIDVSLAVELTRVRGCSIPRPPLVDGRDCD